MLTIAIVNNKGGVGKTTIAMHAAAAWAHYGHPTLYVDLDPQMNGSRTLSEISPFDVTTTITEVLLTPPEKAIPRPWIETIEKDLYLLPCRIDLQQVINEIKASDDVPGLRLRQAMSRMDFDGLSVCILDCPPDLGLINFMALTAADYYLIPMESGSKYSLHGYDLLETFIARVQQINTTLKPLGIVINKHDGRRTLCRAMQTNISARVGAKLVFDTTIPSAPAQIQACETQQRSIFQKDQNCAVGKAFYEFGKEVLGRLNLPIRPHLLPPPLEDVVPLEQAG